MKGTIASAAAVLAAVVTAASAVQAANPNASSSIRGGCDAQRRDEFGGTLDPFRWDESNPTGDAISHESDGSGTSLDEGPLRFMYASGKRRKAELRWSVGTGPVRLPNDGTPLWSAGACWTHDNTFTNTFTVKSLPGTALAAGDPVMLALRPSFSGSIAVGSWAITLGMGGRWMSTGEIRSNVWAETEASSEWLAEYSLFGSATARADERDLFDHPNGFVLEWWDMETGTESNTQAYEERQVSQMGEVCEEWHIDTGCPSVPDPPFSVRSIDEEAAVPFQSVVGARVTVTGYLDMFGEFAVYYQGSQQDLPFIYSHGDFSNDDGLSVEVSPGDDYADDVEIVWDISSTPTTTTTTTTVLATTTTIPVAVCGDGQLGGTEQCDDGDTSWSPGEPCNGSCGLVPCGDPNDSDSITAGDALFLLRSATGSETCAPCVCDVDNNGKLTASDALRMLRRSVNPEIALTCPACS